MFSILYGKREKQKFTFHIYETWRLQFFREDDLIAP